MRRITEIWQTLVGSKELFTSEQRTFHVVCLVASSLMVLGTAQNIYFELYPLVLSMIGVFVTLFVAFLLSRYFNRFGLAWRIFAIFSYAILAVNYFLNAGIEGPTLITTFIILVFLFAISPVSKHWVWASIMVLVFVVVSYMEFKELGPEVIPYKTNTDRYIDMILSYSWTVVFVSAILYKIRSDMRAQNKTISERNQELEVNKAKLELSNKELNRMLSIISHDIRNPLVSVQGYLEVLEAHELDSETRSRMNAELLDLTKSTSQMLDQLLTWSKGQLHGHVITKKTAVVDEFLSETLEAVEAIARHKNLGLVVDLGTNQKVNVDPDLMIIVIRNLMHNALKFTPTGGEVKIESALEDHQWAIKISDTGLGMSKEQVKDLFNFEAKPTFGTNKEKGVGLGLMLVKEFVSLHDGEINVLSRPGIGTTFRIVIPQ